MVNFRHTNLGGTHATIRYCIPDGRCFGLYDFRADLGLCVIFDDPLDRGCGEIDFLRSRCAVNFFNRSLNGGLGAGLQKAAMGADQRIKV